MRSFNWGIFMLITLFSFIVATLSYYRLDGSVVPKAYDISITPYLEDKDGDRQFTFDGVVLITLQAMRPKIKFITLHKDKIVILESALYDNTSMLVQEGIIGSYESKTDMYTLYLKTPLNTNVDYTLLVKYQGQIGEGTEGLYRVGYEYPNVKRKWIAVTRSYRINARKIFPCFDEPAWKASFKMRISRPANFSTLFNTKLIKSQPVARNRYVDHFEETPLMSTYHVAFIVSDFIEQGLNGKYNITPPVYHYITEFSSDVSKKTLKAFEVFTYMAPEDIGFSFMHKIVTQSLPKNCIESCDLVIYRDMFLVRMAKHSIGWLDEEDTITLVTQEMARMWFGYIVTFAWWNCMWLNNAFTRYIQYFIAETIYPQFHFDQHFIVHEIHSIFVIDALNATQPLTYSEENVETQSEINDISSSIAFSKGSSILRMIRYCMGTRNFHESIKAYLRNYQFYNTRPDHLFDHLKRNWPKDPEVNVDQFLRDWTEQVGYPMLIVNITSDERTCNVSIQQKRFLLDPTDGSDPDLLYTIPITYITDFDGPSSYEDLTLEYLENIRGIITFPTKQVTKWIIFNRLQANYYRVFYDKPILDNLKTALMATNFSEIHVINRAQIVDDLFKYAQAGLITYAVVIDFIEYMEKEVDYLPWQAAFTGLTFLANRLTVEYQQKLARLIDAISKKVYDAVGFQTLNDTRLDVYTRNTLIHWICKYGHLDCNKHAQTLMKKIFETGVKPTMDFRETLYCCAMRRNSISVYNKFLELYTIEVMEDEMFSLLRAMGCSNLHYKVHYNHVIESEFPLHHKMVTLQSMYSENPKNVMDIFDMFVSDVERFVERLGAFHAANVINDLANYFTSRKQIKMLRYLILDYGDLFGSYESVLDRGLVKAEKNMDWAENRLGPFMKYLDDNGAHAIYGLSYVSLFLLGVNYYFI